MRVIKFFGMIYLLWITVGGIVFSLTQGIDKGMIVGIGGGLLLSAAVSLYLVVVDVVYRIGYFVRYGELSFDNYYKSFICVDSSIVSAVLRVKDSIPRPYLIESEIQSEGKAELVGILGAGTRSSRIVIRIINDDSSGCNNIEINSCPVSDTTLFDAGLSLRNVCRLRKAFKGAFGSEVRECGMQARAVAGPSRASDDP